MTADEINGVDRADELDAIDLGLHFHTNFAPVRLRPQRETGTKTAPDGPPPTASRALSPAPAGSSSRRRPSGAGHRIHGTTRAV